MPRVKRGRAHIKRRRNILKQAKGFTWGRKNKLRQAKTAITKAGKYSYRDRRNRKRDFRALWQIRIGAATRLNNLNYSRFMGNLKKANVKLDRKVLAELAEHHPAVFEKIVKEIR